MGVYVLAKYNRSVISSVELSTVCYKAVTRIMYQIHYIIYLPELALVVAPILA